MSGERRLVDNEIQSEARSKTMSDSSWDIQDKLCLITGATSGIGKQTALELAGFGASVVIHGRDEEKCRRTKEEISEVTGNPALDFLIADLSSQAELRALALEFQKRYNHLDVLINNAGCYYLSRRESVDGIEMTLAVNHLAYFSLSLLLLDQILASSSARIINVSSEAHRSAHINFEDLQGKQRFLGFLMYGQSKLANVLFTYDLSRRLAGKNVSVNAVHPGLVATHIGSDNGPYMKIAFPFMKLFMQPVEKGAQTSIYLASSGAVGGVSGKYFKDCEAVSSSPESHDPEIASRLWQVSEQLTGLSGII